MSGGQAAVVLVLAAGAVLALPRAGPASGAASRRLLAPGLRRALLSGLGLAAAGALLSLPVPACLALGCAGALLTRLAPRRRRSSDIAEMRSLAGVLDLLATCLDAGLPVPHAIGAVLSATDGMPPGTGPHRRPAQLGAPHRVALTEVAALLALGADPGSAWRPAERTRELAGVAAAARRSAVGGVRLADAVREAAADLRRECRVAGERSAARAGVAITAPLTLCFLPAFLCLGLAPVIVGLIGSLHIW